MLDFLRSGKMRERVGAGAAGATNVVIYEYVYGFH